MWYNTMINWYSRIGLNDQYFCLSSWSNDHMYVKGCHTHRRSIFSQQQLEVSHWGTEAGSQHGVTRGRKEKHSAIHTCTCRDIKPRKRTPHKHTHTAGMPCRHHWHLDGFGTMRAQWRPVAGSLPHWASQWSVSHTEAGCSLGKREQEEEWDTE